MGAKLDQSLAVLNGLLGDHLSWRKNGLATEMAFYRQGQPVSLNRLGEAYPEARNRVVVLVHGLMCTERVWSFPDGEDYGSRLEREHGITPFYVRYNTGRSVVENGAALAELLERWVQVYPFPLEEFLLVGYSMGGLLIRGACEVGARAGHQWPHSVRRAITIGTPHLGVPAERVGRVVAAVLLAINDPYTRLVAQIGNLRSRGIRDLGEVSSLWPGIEHHLIAGSISTNPRLALLGDALVPIASATLGGMDSVTVLPGVGHLSLAHHPEVYAQLARICGEPGTKR